MAGLNAKDKGSIVLSCIQVGVKTCAKVANVHKTRGGGCKSCSNCHNISLLFLRENPVLLKRVVFVFAENEVVLKFDSNSTQKIIDF